MSLGHAVRRWRDDVVRLPPGRNVSARRDNVVRPGHVVAPRCVHSRARIAGGPDNWILLLLLMLRLLRLAVRGTVAEARSAEWLRECGQTLMGQCTFAVVVLLRDAGQLGG